MGWSRRHSATYVGTPDPPRPSRSGSVSTRSGRRWTWWSRTTVAGPRRTPTGAGWAWSGCGSGSPCTAARSQRDPGPAAASGSARGSPVADASHEPPDGEPIRVFLVDDQAMVRAGFRMLVESQPDLRVVGEAGDGLQALQQLAVTPADVVLMDIRMPRLDGVETTRRLGESA